MAEETVNISTDSEEVPSPVAPNKNVEIKKEKKTKNKIRAENKSHFKRKWEMKTLCV